jgi:glycosyltransferase involved in cell wall biosynthesis
LASPVLSIVVPAFNEQASIGLTIDRLREQLARLAAPWEIIVVDDGSTDHTSAVVDAIAASDRRVRLVPQDHAGKGSAVRRGMLAAHGEWRFMADADLSMPPDNLHRFLALVSREPAPHIVIGSREAPGSRRVGEPWRRHAIGRIFNRLVQLVVLPGISDTQCGFKLFSASSAAALFPELTIAGFAFDVELLFRARRAGFTIQEVGIVWNCRTETRVGWSRGARAFVDVVRIWWRVRADRSMSTSRIAAASNPAIFRRACS